MSSYLPDLLASDVPWLWISARSLGISAWLASSLTVLLGLVAATRRARGRKPAQPFVMIHRSVAISTVVLVVAHIATLIPDPYAKLSIIGALVPGMAQESTAATALGSVAFLILVAVSVANATRRRLSVGVWRSVHACAFAVWPLATAHFILIGTDAMTTPAVIMLLVVSGLLVSLVLVRGFSTSKVGNDPRLNNEAAKRRGANQAATRALAAQALKVAPLTVAKVVAETADTKTFELAIPAQARAEFDYLPGQFLTIRVPSDVTGSVARCYSLSSAPSVDTNLRITVKRTVGGYASNWLNDNLAEGMELDSLAPSGRFTVPENAAELLLFAGGSGITPMMSIISEELAKQEPVPITLVYANRDPESIIFVQQLRQLTKTHPGKLVVHHWLASISGLPTTADVAQQLAPHRSADILVCGPPPFMDLIVGAARDFGWPAERVRKEEFRSLQGDPFAQPQRQVASADATEPGGGSQLKTRPLSAHVKLEGRSHRVEWSPDSSLVDAMLESGIRAPYSCREGICATCECLVVKGNVDTGSGVAGVGQTVLGCQIRPTEEGAEIHF